jgi:branched-chain amino acid transport system permease protein/neutral amino acid transport system permease protein
MLLSLFLQRTKLGKAMRATADNFDLALVSGIDTERVVLWTWAIGNALAAAGGVLLGMSVRLQPIMGWDLLLPIFAAAILGGIGSPYGAMVGALLIGLAEELSTPFIHTSYKPAVSLIILVLVLLVRPQGIFGKVSR